MHECGKAVNGAQTMTSVISLYAIPFHFLYAYRIFYLRLPRLLFTPTACFLYAYRVFHLPTTTKVPLPTGGQVYLTTRLGDRNP